MSWDIIHGDKKGFIPIVHCLKFYDPNSRISRHFGAWQELDRRTCQHECIMHRKARTCFPMMIRSLPTKKRDPKDCHDTKSQLQRFRRCWPTPDQVMAEATRKSGFDECPTKEKRTRNKNSRPVKIGCDSFFGCVQTRNHVKIYKYRCIP